MNAGTADNQGAPAVRSRHRVLVTDDEPITRMLLRLMFEREHFEVLEAGNGREAAEIVARERLDVLLIDLNMPEMDGYEAVERLRRGLGVTTPIVVLTSETGPDVERRVLDLGADDYITKPVDPAILLSRVQAAFRRLNAGAA
jgi:DNA-binding response OmpR family regulator